MDDSPCSSSTEDIFNEIVYESTGSSSSSSTTDNDEEQFSDLEELYEVKESQQTAYFPYVQREDDCFVYPHLRYLSHDTVELFHGNKRGTFEILILKNGIDMDLADQNRLQFHCLEEDSQDALTSIDFLDNQEYALYGTFEGNLDIVRFSLQDAENFYDKKHIFTTDQSFPVCNARINHMDSGFICCSYYNCDLNKDELIVLDLARQQDITAPTVLSKFYVTEEIFDIRWGWYDSGLLMMSAGKTLRALDLRDRNKSPNTLHMAYSCSLLAPCKYRDSLIAAACQIDDSWKINMFDIRKLACPIFQYSVQDEVAREGIHTLRWHPRQPYELMYSSRSACYIGKIDTESCYQFSTLPLNHYGLDLSQTRHFKLSMDRVWDLPYQDETFLYTIEKSRSSNYPIVEEPIQLPGYYEQYELAQLDETKEIPLIVTCPWFEIQEEEEEEDDEDSLLEHIASEQLMEEGQDDAIKEEDVEDEDEERDDEALAVDQEIDAEAIEAGRVNFEEFVQQMSRMLEKGEEQVDVFDEKYWNAGEETQNRVVEIEAEESANKIEAASENSQQEKLTPSKYNKFNYKYLELMKNSFDFQAKSFDHSTPPSPSNAVESLLDSMEQDIEMSPFEEDNKLVVGNKEEWCVEEILQKMELSQEIKSKLREVVAEILPEDSAMSYEHAQEMIKIVSEHLEEEYRKRGDFRAISMKTEIDDESGYSTNAPVLCFSYPINDLHGAVYLTSHDKGKLQYLPDTSPALSSFPTQEFTQTLAKIKAHDLYEKMSLENWRSYYDKLVDCQKSPIGVKHTDLIKSIMIGEENVGDWLMWASASVDFYEGPIRSEFLANIHREYKAIWEEKRKKRAAMVKQAMDIVEKLRKEALMKPSESELRLEAARNSLTFSTKRLANEADFLMSVHQTIDSRHFLTQLLDEEIVETPEEEEESGIRIVFDTPEISSPFESIRSSATTGGTSPDDQRGSVAMLINMEKRGSIPHTVGTPDEGSITESGRKRSKPIPIGFNRKLSGAHLDKDTPGEEGSSLKWLFGSASSGKKWDLRTPSGRSPRTLAEEKAARQRLNEERRRLGTPEPRPEIPRSLSLRRRNDVSISLLNTDHSATETFADIFGEDSSQARTPVDPNAQEEYPDIETPKKEEPMPIPLASSATDSTGTELMSEPSTQPQSPDRRESVIKVEDAEEKESSDEDLSELLKLTIAPEPIIPVRQPAIIKGTSRLLRGPEPLRHPEISTSGFYPPMRSISIGKPYNAQPRSDIPPLIPPVIETDTTTPVVQGPIPREPFPIVTVMRRSRRSTFDEKRMKEAYPEKRRSLELPRTVDDLATASKKFFPIRVKPQAEVLPENSLDSMEGLPERRVYFPLSEVHRIVEEHPKEKMDSLEDEPLLVELAKEAQESPTNMELIQAKEIGHEEQEEEEKHEEETEEEAEDEEFVEPMPESPTTPVAPSPVEQLEDEVTKVEELEAPHVDANGIVIQGDDASQFEDLDIEDNEEVKESHSSLQSLEEQWNTSDEEAENYRLNRKKRIPTYENLLSFVYKVKRSKVKRTKRRRRFIRVPEKQSLTEMSRLRREKESERSSYSHYFHGHGPLEACSSFSSIPNTVIASTTVPRNQIVASSKSVADRFIRPKPEIDVEIEFVDTEKKKVAEEECSKEILVRRPIFFVLPLPINEEYQDIIIEKSAFDLEVKGFPGLLQLMETELGDEEELTEVPWDNCLVKHLKLYSGTFRERMLKSLHLAQEDFKTSLRRKIVSEEDYYNRMIISLLQGKLNSFLENVEDLYLLVTSETEPPSESRELVEQLVNISIVFVQFCEHYRYNQDQGAMMRYKFEDSIEEACAEHNEFLEKNEILLMVLLLLKQEVMEDGQPNILGEAVMQMKTIPMNYRLLFVIRACSSSTLDKCLLQALNQTVGIDRLMFVGVGRHYDTFAVLAEYLAETDNFQQISHILLASRALEDDDNYYLEVHRILSERDEELEKPLEIDEQFKTPDMPEELFQQSEGPETFSLMDFMKYDAEDPNHPVNKLVRLWKKDIPGGGVRLFAWMHENGRLPPRHHLDTIYSRRYIMAPYSLATYFNVCKQVLVRYLHFLGTVDSIVESHLLEEVTEESFREFRVESTTLFKNHLIHLSGCKSLRPHIHPSTKLISLCTFCGMTRTQATIIRKKAEEEERKKVAATEKKRGRKKIQDKDRDYEADPEFNLSDENGSMNCPDTEVKGYPEAACPNCRRPTARCSICHLVDRTAWNKHPKKKFERQWTVCCKCQHGGHVLHMTSWFQKNNICPVPDCDCPCSRSELFWSVKEWFEEFSEIFPSSKFNF